MERKVGDQQAMEEGAKTSMLPHAGGLGLGLRWRHLIISDQKLFCGCPNLDRPVESPGCLYERGDQKPRNPSLDQLRGVAGFASSLGCRVVDQVQVLCRPRRLLWREEQRGFLLAWGGVLPVGQGEVCLEQVSLQERVVWGGRGGGRPEVEVVTGTTLQTVAEVQDVAQKLLDTLRGLGLAVANGLQGEVELVFPGGRSVLLCGLRSFAHLEGMLEAELERQLGGSEHTLLWDALVGEGQQAGVEGQTRRWIGRQEQSEAFAQDVASEAPWRREPLCEPISLEGLLPQGEELPLAGWRWRQQWSGLGLPQDMCEGILAQGWVALFVQLQAAAPKVPPLRWGELLARWPRALARRGVPIHQLTSQRLLAVGSLFAMGRCHREALVDLLAFVAYFPETPVRHLLTHTMGLQPMHVEDLRAQLPSLLEGPPPHKASWAARERFWMGRLMERLRGTLSGYEVYVELHRYFSVSPPTPLDLRPFPPPKRRKGRSKRKRPGKRHRPPKQR